MNWNTGSQNWNTGSQNWNTGSQNWNTGSQNWNTDLSQKSVYIEERPLSEIKKEAYKEILKSLDDKLSDCAVMSDGEYCGYYCSDIRGILRELEDEYEIHS